MHDERSGLVTARKRLCFARRGLGDEELFFLHALHVFPNPALSIRRAESLFNSSMNEIAHVLKLYGRFPCMLAVDGLMSVVAGAHAFLENS